MNIISKCPKPRQFAWILLSLKDTPASLTEIIGVADCINHALPSAKQLQESLGWLLENELVDREGQKYFLTEAGKDVCDTKSKTALEAWEAVKFRLSGLSGKAGSEDLISFPDIELAYKIYNKAPGKSKTK